MGRIVFRLILVGIAAALAAWLLRSGPDPTVGPAADSAAERPAAAPVGPAVSERAAPQPQRRALRYEQATSGDTLRPPPLPERSPRDRSRRFNRVVVESATLLKAEGLAIRLSGLESPDNDDICRGENGEPWPCGRMGQTALARLIRSRSIECVIEPLNRGTAQGRCSVALIDINDWLVRQGWAKPADEAAYAEAAAEAKAAGAGLWGGRQARQASP